MKYQDGSPVLLGDIVSLGAGISGQVVAVIDSGEFSRIYPEGDWAYLKVGALVESSEAGLIHCPSSAFDFILLKRGAT